MPQTQFSQLPEDSFTVIGRFQDYLSLAQLSLSNSFFYHSETLKYAMHEKLRQDFSFPDKFNDADDLTRQQFAQPLETFFRGLVKETQNFLKLYAVHFSEHDLITNLQTSAAFLSQTANQPSLIELIASQANVRLFYVALTKAKPLLTAGELQQVCCQLLYRVTKMQTHADARLAMAKLILPHVGDQIDNNLGPVQEGLPGRILQASALLNAMVNEDFAMVELLLSQGANKEASCFINTGNGQSPITPAEYAREYGSAKLCELLKVSYPIHRCNIL